MRRWEDRVRAGQCGNCGKPQDREGPLCSGCVRKQRDWQRNDRESKRRSGLCIYCGQQAVDSKNVCRRHLEKERDRVQRLRDSGLCAGCQFPLDRDGKYCKSCCAVRRAKATGKKNEAMRKLCGGAPRCQCPGCRTTAIEFLTFDHVRSDGHRETASQRASMAKRILSADRPQDRYRVLCWNCNSARDKHGGPEKRCPYENHPHGG